MAEPTARIERFRSYLRVLAEAQTGRALRGRIDLSGVVQQTLWEGRQSLQADHANTSDIRRLLHRILTHNLQDEVRRATAQRRDVRLERSIEASSLRLAGLLASDEPSPSANVLNAERAMLVAEAMMQLNPEQREVIVRHYLSGETVDQTAHSMDRTAASVAGLLHRGLKRLREMLDDNPASTPETQR